MRAHAARTTEDAMPTSKKKPAKKVPPPTKGAPKARSGELSEDQLEHVAGGAFDAYIKVDQTFIKSSS